MKPEDIRTWLDRDKFTDDDFLRLIAPYVQVKPWKHKWSFQNVCHHCEKFVWETSGYDSPCTIPPPVTQSLAEVAFEMRDRCKSGDWMHALLDIIPDDMRMARIPPSYWIVAAIIVMEAENENN